MIDHRPTASTAEAATKKDPAKQMREIVRVYECVCVGVCTFACACEREREDFEK